MNLLSYEIAIVSIFRHNESTTIYQYQDAERNPILLRPRKQLLDLKVPFFT